MKCVYCSMSGEDIKNAEFLIKGMSLCAAHYHGWEDGLFTIEDVEKGNIEIEKNSSVIPKQEIFDVTGYDKNND